MGFGTVSDPLLAFALWSGVGASAATLALGLAIIGARLRLLWRLALERRAAERWNPLIAQCAERVPQSLPPLRASEVQAFLVLWCRAQESLRGGAQAQLRELARRLDVAPRARAQLHSGRLRFKLLALVTLGHLRERGAVDALLALVPEAPSVVSLTAAQALMRIDPGLGVPCVLAALARREDWALAPVASMLQECDPRQVGLALVAAIGAELRRQPDAADAGLGLARLLRLHVAAHDEVLRPAVLEVLSGATGSEALAAALAALQHPLDAAYARGLLTHDATPVRVAAARALGRLGVEEDLERLCAALADRDWWVRYRAAQALCALPRMDSARLRAVAERLQDRFARDMLTQALAERDAA